MNKFAFVLAMSVLGTDPVQAPQFIGHNSTAPLGAFECPDTVNGAPCLRNPNGIVEITGQMPDVNYDLPWTADIEVCTFRQRRAGYIFSVMNGPSKVYWVKWDGSTRQLGDIVLAPDGPEAKIRVEPASAASNARLSMQGSVPEFSAGPDVYVQAGHPRSAGDLFQVINVGTVTNSFSYQGAVGFGKVSTGQLPVCNSEFRGRVLFNDSRACLALCDGFAWKCLVAESQ